jgi:cytidine deaminase
VEYERLRNRLREANTSPLGPRVLASVRVDPDTLVERAREARTRAYAPFSGFAVGAALLADDGRVFTGCNVENRSFGLALCAERCAVAAAVAAGARSFLALAVVTDAAPPAPPCGACRETLAEFCGPELAIHLAGADGARRDTTLGALFPEPFVFDARRAPAGDQPRRAKS